MSPKPKLIQSFTTCPEGSHLVLGQLINNPFRPTIDAWIPSASLVLPGDVTATRLKDVTKDWNDGSETKISVKLAKLLRFGVGGRKNDEGKVSAVRWDEHELVNQMAVLKRVWEDPSGREYVEEMFELNKHVYMVVGLAKPSNASVGTIRTNEKSVDGGATLPSEPLGAPGLDTEVTASTSTHHNQGNSYTAPGEHIIGMTVVRLDVTKKKGVKGLKAGKYTDVTFRSGSDDDAGGELEVALGGTTLQQVYESVGMGEEVEEEDYEAVEGGGVVRLVYVGRSGDEEYDE